MNKKYILLKNDTINVDGRKLYRIKAIKNFGIIEKGQLGGYIETEYNLSHDDNCWIYDKAKAYDDAEIFHNTTIYGNAKIFGRATIFDNAIICGNAKIHGDALVRFNAKIHGNADISKGIIIGNVFTSYDDIFQIQCKKRLLTAIKKDNNILYTIGCQKNITKEEFLDRIYNENGGIEKFPHRKEYLKVIKLVEQYFEEV